MYFILIVEDDEFQRAYLKKMLQSLNKTFNIYEASNAVDAFNVTKQVDINLFLVDIDREKSSGIDLANKLRTVSKYKFTWIIFLTIHIECLTEAFKKVHCYDFILKPYNKDKIIFIEVNMKTIFVYTRKRNYKLQRITLKKILSLIDEETIVQSHKFFAINLKYINKIEKINSGLFKVYFKNCSYTALIGNKFKNLY